MSARQCQGIERMVYEKPQARPASVAEVQFPDSLQIAAIVNLFLRETPYHQHHSTTRPFSHSAHPLRILRWYNDYVAATDGGANNVVLMQPANYINVGLYRSNRARRS